MENYCHKLRIKNCIKIDFLLLLCVSFVTYNRYYLMLFTPTQVQTIVIT